MQGWLSQWGVPAMPMTPGGMDDMPGQDMPGMDMGTGMMSDEDMAALRDAQGTAASRLFRTQMIQHHQGAITMSQREIGQGRYPATVALAKSIVDSQQQEIDEMNKILASL